MNPRSVVPAGLSVALILGCGAGAGEPSLPVAPPASAAVLSAPSAVPALPLPQALPASPVAEAHPEARPVAADLAAMRTLGEVRISPDGERVAYVARVPSFDPKAKASDDDTSGGWKVEEQLFVARRKSGEIRQLTRGQDRVASPRWSPDGRSVAFLRKRGKHLVLHVLPLDGGEAEPLDLGELEPEAFAFSRDGASIAFTATPPAPQEEKDAAFRSGGVIDQGKRWRSADLYVVPRAGGEPRRITRGVETVVDFAWSPDGARFALLVGASADPYDASTRVVPRIVSATDGARIKDLEAQPGSMTQIGWSPDGRYVTYLRGQDTLSLQNALTVHDVAAGRSWNAAAKLDPTLAGYAWSADAKRITLLVLERTASKLYRVPAEGGTPVDLGPTTRFLDAGDLVTDRTGRFVAVASSTNLDPRAPSVVDLDKGTVEVVAQLNPQVSGWKLGRTEVVRWKSPEGTEIEGLLVATPHVAAGAPAPLVVMPHGGPDSVSSDQFSGLAQYFAARGYSVFRPNYRGSFGYGRAFYAANRGRLGAIELMDIESGVDQLIQAGKADPKRLYYGSWSWGGYLTAWTIGHTTRYRAAMVGAGIVDVTLQYSLSDINHGAAAEWEFKGNPWKQPQRFDDADPRRFLDKVVTPTLIAHGENDSRVPDAQAMILYRALSDVGCEVRLLRFPREPHGFREPAHQVSLLTSWAGWFATH